MTQTQSIGRILLVSLALALGLNLSANAQTRNATEYNLDQGIALKGYDPVSYFPEGGARPQIGKRELRLDYMGVTYYFSSPENLDLFAQNSEKYEPTYGGWCAYAMASGSKVDIQPTIFTLNGNRLHFFVSRRAKQNFDSDVVGHETRADAFWKDISGEEPRF